MSREYIWGLKQAKAIKCCVFAQGTNRYGWFRNTYRCAKELNISLLMYDTSSSANYRSKFSFISLTDRMKAIKKVIQHKTASCVSKYMSQKDAEIKENECSFLISKCNKWTEICFPKAELLIFLTPVWKRTTENICLVLRLSLLTTISEIFFTVCNAFSFSSTFPLNVNYDTWQTVLTRAYRFALTQKHFSTFLTSILLVIIRVCK